MTPEHKIQNEIRNALVGKCLLFRANVGQAWSGEVISRDNGEVTLANARPFSSGLPNGFSDLFGMTLDGRFIALEVKTPEGRVSEEQEKFIAAIKKRGGLAAVVRSVEEALRVLAEA